MASSSKTELLLLTKLVLAKNAAQVAAAAANAVVIAAVAVVASVAVVVASVAAVVVAAVAVVAVVVIAVVIAVLATNTILLYLSKKHLPVLDRKMFFYACYTLDLISLCHGGLCSYVLSN